MYTVNTNVVITALNAADPQSHRDQASTGTVSRRCGRVRPASAEEGEVMTLTVGTDRSPGRSEEHTSELQSRGHLVCRLLLEKKKRPSEDRMIRFAAQ